MKIVVGVKRVLDYAIKVSRFICQTTIKISTSILLLLGES